MEANTANMVVRRITNVPEEVEVMNEANSRLIWTYMQEAGGMLMGKLPPSKHHQTGRNPYAHVAVCVKKKFGKSYKDIPDEVFDDVIEYINFLVENPS